MLRSTWIDFALICSQCNFMIIDVHGVLITFLFADP